MNKRLGFVLLLLLLSVASGWAATTRYVSTGGSGDCSSANPCSLNTAKGQAAPGDTITLGDGTYSGSTTINCSSGAQNGTAGARITLKATNERQAHLAGTGLAPLQFYNCNYWTIEGLHLTNSDNGATVSMGPGSGIWLQDSNNMILRRLLVLHPNRYQNTHAIEFYIANDNLVEECEVYDFHRHGVIVQTGSRNTYRRNYVNSRGWPDLQPCDNSQDGVHPWCSNNPAGDNGLMVYPAAQTIMENNISENNAFGLDMNAKYGNSESNHYYGNLANNNYYGFSLTAGDQPYVSDMPLNSIWENNVAITGATTNRGFRGRSTKNLQASNNTVIGRAAEASWMLDWDPAGPGDGSPTSYTKNLLVTQTSSSGNLGVSITGQSIWALDYVNVFNFTANTPGLGDSHITHASTTNPGLGACYAWLPDSSPMKGAGLGGADIGASILYRYQDGVLTSTPLWDPSTGAFPCGTVVAGVNDNDANNCRGIPARFHINQGGCAFPSSYGGAPPGPAATTRLVVPSGGATSGDCLTTACTLDRARSQAVPGDTITLANGTYSQATISCGSNAVNGTASQPIILKATNERQAHLHDNGSYALDLINCAYWSIEGIRFSGADVNNGDWHSVVDVITSNHLTFKSNLFDHDNRYNNVHLLDLNCDDCLVEENEFYHFHRHGLHQYYANNNTIRRNYLHSRNWADIVPGGYPSGPDDRGDEGISVYPGSNNLMENNIVENTGSAFTIDASTDSVGNQYYGNIALNNVEGWYPNARSNTLASMPQNTVIRQSIAILGSGIGFRFPGNKNTQCTNCSSIGNASNGFYAGVESGAPGDGAPTAFFTNSLALNNANVGFQFVSQSNWGVNYGNAFASGTAFSPNDSHITNSLTTDPQMGTCYAWVPDTSPRQGAGLGGADIGATILYRYQNGVLSSTPLWNTTTGAFPCGALVAGLNDSAGDSCSNVHSRLHINTSGCLFPSGYGGGSPVEPPPAGPNGVVQAVWHLNAGAGTPVGDSVGDHPGVFTPTAGWVLPGLLGPAGGDFNGARTVQVSNVAGLRSVNAATLSAWIKFNGINDTCDVVSNGDAAYIRLQPAGTATGGFFDGSTWPSVTGGSNLGNNQRRHVLWTYDRTNEQLWVDGVLVATSPQTSPIDYSLGPTFKIGEHANSRAFYTCTGVIDEVSVLNGPCDAACVANLYAAKDRRSRRLLRAQ